MTMLTAQDVTMSSAIAPALAQTSSLTNTGALTWLRAACLASLQALSASGVGLRMNAGSGPTLSEYCASYDPDTGFLKTRQASLLSNQDAHSRESSVDWPRSGMMLGGNAYPLPPLVQVIDETVSLFWLPTPTARDWKDTPGMARQAGSRNREDQLPRRIFSIENSQKGDGTLNPAFVLWLMGFPANWFDHS